jgi:hypothetical protein
METSIDFFSNVGKMAWSPLGTNFLEQMRRISKEVLAVKSVNEMGVVQKPKKVSRLLEQIRPAKRRKGRGDGSSGVMN